MLCELAEAGGGLVSTWVIMSILETIFLFATSAPVFYYYYWPTKVYTKQVHVCTGVAQH